MAHLKILVADDDRDDFEMLKEAFGNSNELPEFDYVENGAELLLRLKKVTSGNAPDLIVLDLNMPKVDGLQALIRIKKDISLQNIPVFIHSTSNSSDQMNQCQALGASAYVVKGRTYSSFFDFARRILQFLDQRREEILHSNSV
jgi:CheY-like chemotaxis protein